MTSRAGIHTGLGSWDLAGEPVTQKSLNWKREGNDGRERNEVNWETRVWWWWGSVMSPTCLHHPTPITRNLCPLHAQNPTALLIGTLDLLPSPLHPTLLQFISTRIPHWCSDVMRRQDLSRLPFPGVYAF